MILSKLVKRSWHNQAVSYTGAPALTSRGLKEADFERVVELLDKGVKIALNVQKQTSEWLFCLALF